MVNVVNIPYQSHGCYGYCLGCPPLSVFGGIHGGLGWDFQTSRSVIILVVTFTGKGDNPTYMFSSVSRSSRGIFERFRSFMCFLLARVARNEWVLVKQYTHQVHCVNPSSFTQALAPRRTQTQNQHKQQQGHTLHRLVTYTDIHTVDMYTIHIYIIYEHVCIALSWLPNNFSHSERPSFASPKSTFQWLLCGHCFIFCDDLFFCNKHHSCNCILFIQLTYPTLVKRKIIFTSALKKRIC